MAGPRSTPAAAPPLNTGPSAGDRAKGAALGIIGDILGRLDKAFLGFGDVVNAVTEGARNAKGQLEEFKHFDFDPQWKTKVISVPRAVHGAESLWLGIRQDLIGKMQEIVTDAEELINEIKTLPSQFAAGSEGASGAAVAIGKAELIVNLIHAFNTTLADLITKVFDLGPTITRIKHRIETLDDLFLPQTSEKTPAADHVYRKRLKQS